MVGLLTALSLLSPTHGTVTGWWVKGTSLLVGWGVYLVPVVLLVIGLWLVLRNLERLPVLSLERIVGIILLFLVLVVWMHLLAGGGLDLAKAGRGGGYVGGWLEQGLVSTLGLVGCVIALVAILLISLVFTFDLSVADIFHWVSPLLARLKSLRRPSLAGHPQATPALPSAADGTSGLQPGFTPFARAPASSGGRPGKGQSPIEAGRLLPEGEPTPPGAARMPVPTVQAAAPAAPWRLPLIEDILEAGLPAVEDGNIDRDRAHLIEETLASFGAPAHVVEVHKGPTITQFGVEPDFVELRRPHPGAGQ